MIAYPNLCTAFARGLEVADTKREGDELAHASDLGKCLLQVWARRNGQPMVKRSAKTRARLQGGLRDEEWIYQRVLAGMPEGWTIERSGTLSAMFSDLAGHLDFTLAFHAPEGIYRAVIDVKTTEWREVWEPTGELDEVTQKPLKTKTYIPYEDAPGRTAILQVLTYSRGLPKNPDGKHAPFAIMQHCRRSFLMAQFPGPGEYYDADDQDLLSEWIAEKGAVVEKTFPGADPVATGIATRNIVGDLMGEPPLDTYNNKGVTWACRYCDFYGCARNANPDAEVLS
jgi:hypothetical protein